MDNEQVNFGGAGDANNAARHPVPIQEHQWDLQAAAAEPWERERRERYQVRIDVAQIADLVLLGIPSDNNRREPTHTEE